jgi:hypothetical protein
LTIEVETAQTNLKINSKELRTVRLELANQMKFSRKTESLSEQYQDNCRVLQNSLDISEGIANNAVLKSQVNNDTLASLKIDRDRYMDLYTHENELRLKLDLKGESTDQLLYEVQKELAERRTRMHFTENIIDGKQKRIDDLEKYLEDKDIESENHLSAFTNMKDIKEQLEETVTKKLDEAEKHHDIVHKMMIKNHALEKRLDEAGESHKKMNATVEHTQ